MQAVGTVHGTWHANGCISEQVVVGALRAADVIVVVGTGLLVYVARFSILEDLGPVEIYALVISGLLNVPWEYAWLPQNAAVHPRHEFLLR